MKTILSVALRFGGILCIVFDVTDVRGTWFEDDEDLPIRRVRIEGYQRLSRAGSGKQTCLEELNSTDQLKEMLHELVGKEWKIRKGGWLMRDEKIREIERRWMMRH